MVRGQRYCTHGLTARQNGGVGGGEEALLGRVVEIISPPLKQPCAFVIPAELGQAATKIMLVIQTIK